MSWFFEKSYSSNQLCESRVIWIHFVPREKYEFNAIGFPFFKPDCVCRDPGTWQKVQEVDDLSAGVMTKLARQENKDAYLTFKRILELFNELEVKF